MRQLASIQKIKEILPIEVADQIVLAKILDWQCVVKKDEFNVDDLCLFFEIDSLLPDEPRYEFLKKSCWRDGINKYRLKSIKLKKVLSQGVAMPIDKFPEIGLAVEGADVTEFLGIEKYEPPVPTAIQGDVKGGFSWPISKTDEERVQNNDKYRFIEALWGRPYYISLKLDGTSSTFLIDAAGDYHVCGRNYSYKEKPDHMFWKLSEKYDIENKLRKLHQDGFKVAIQGEVIGNIQGNKMKVTEPDIYIFNVVDIETNKKLPIDDALDIIKRIELKFVPIIEQGDNFKYTINELFTLSDIKYKDFFPNASPQQQAEGIVVRSKDSDISFKVINNNFLLKENE
jgi:RNA ligase (TIGR02306 family)